MVRSLCSRADLPRVEQHNIRSDWLYPWVVASLALALSVSVLNSHLEGLVSPLTGGNVVVSGEVTDLIHSQGQQESQPGRTGRDVSTWQGVADWSLALESWEG